ncbi:MAG TPA: MFS transporter [Acidimicrobiales bacterium]|nr:MFS transporter [Acidimicrobiales bacterium]
MDASTQSRTWVTRNLVVLSFVSFLQDTASELLYPVLPIFLTATLGAPVAVVGSIEAVAEGVAAIAKYGAGRVADRVQPRRIVGLGYGLAALGKLIVAVAGVWPVVLAGRGVDRLGKGIRGAPRDALLIEDIPVHARGRAFGVHRAADTAGAVVGPLLGLALYEAFGHRIRPLLLIAVIPGVLSALAVSLARDSHVVARVRAARASGEARIHVPIPDDARRVIGALAIFSFVNFPDALLLLRAHELGHGVAGVILLYCVYNFSYAALSYPAGALADRLAANIVYALGLACFAIAYFGLGVIEDPRWAWPLFVVYGGFQAATDGVGKSWVSRLVPAEIQGRTQGTLQAANGFGVLVAGIWAGLAWRGTGSVPLVISGAVALLAAAYVATALRARELSA